MNRKGELEALRVDYEQAWEHYRHLENLRTSYLGFFFTVALGSASILLPVLVGAPWGIDLKVVAACCFLVVFSALAYFVYLSVQRAGWVLEHYRLVMENIRSRRAGLLRRGRGSDFDFVTVPSQFSDFRFQRRYGVHGTAERTVLSAMIFAWALSIGCALAAWHMSAWVALGISAAVVILTTGLVTMAIRLRILGEVAEARRRSQAASTS